MIRFTRKRCESGADAAPTPAQAAGPAQSDPSEGAAEASAGAVSSSAAYLAAEQAACGGGSGGGAGLQSGASPPPSVGVFLPPRSLLLFSGDAYTSCLHSIEAAEEDFLDETIDNAPPELRGDLFAHCAHAGCLPPASACFAALCVLASLFVQSSRVLAPACLYAWGVVFGVLSGLLTVCARMTFCCFRLASRDAGKAVRRESERVSLTCRLVPKVLKNILPIRR